MGGITMILPRTSKKENLYEKRNILSTDGTCCHCPAPRHAVDRKTGKRRRRALSSLGKDAQICVVALLALLGFVVGAALDAPGDHVGPDEAAHAGAGHSVAGLTRRVQ
jgi:hypothetical protein